MDGEVKVSILQWENLRKEIGELTEENARLKNQQGQVKLTLVDKEYGGSFKYNRFTGRNEFIPEGKEVETTQYVNMDGIIKVLREEAEDNVSSDVEKFKQDISILKEEKSAMSEKHLNFINKLEKDNEKQIERLKEKFKKDKEELKENFEKEKTILLEKVDELQRKIDGVPLTDKEMVTELQEKIKQLEKSNLILKDKLPFWKR